MKQPNKKNLRAVILTRRSPSREVVHEQAATAVALVRSCALTRPQKIALNKVSHELARQFGFTDSKFKPLVFLKQCGVPSEELETL